MPRSNEPTSIGCDETVGDLMDTKDQSPARHDRAIGDPAERGRGDANHGGEPGHRDRMFCKEVVELH